jgi:hypothetical protein
MRELSEAEQAQVSGGQGAIVIKENEKEKGDSRVDFIITPQHKVIEPGRD